MTSTSRDDGTVSVGGLRIDADKVRKTPEPKGPLVLSRTTWSCSKCGWISLCSPEEVQAHIDKRHGS